MITFKFSLDQSLLRKSTLKNSMRFSFTPYPTHGKNKATYRDEILKEGPTRRHLIYSITRKQPRKSTKEYHLPKTPNVQKTTVPVLAGRKIEEPTRHPTLRRAVLTSTRKSMQSFRDMGRPVQKNMNVAWTRALLLRVQSA